MKLEIHRHRVASKHTQTVIQFLNHDVKMETANKKGKKKIKEKKYMNANFAQT